MKTNFLFIFAFMVASIAHKISDFGAIPNNKSSDCVILNGKAIEQAIIAANSTLDRLVLIEGNSIYHMVPSSNLNNLINITIQIDGTLVAWDGDLSFWPRDGSNNSMTMLSVSNSYNVTFTGNGIIEGFGYRWWWQVILIGDDNRPDLLYVGGSMNVLIENLTFSNSPRYHLNLQNVAHCLVQNINITVDVFGQQAFLREHGFLYQNFIPTFPLNTDGIDVSGIDVVIRNSSIICFDDAVAVKPMISGRSNFTNCTRNILIEDCYVKYGVGMSIGSVPPHVGVDCVQNITIRNIEFESPIKAIYIKSNPGTQGTALIQHILYEKIKIRNALMWAIFIGPQQQHQPHGGADTGCSFFYPLPFTECPTNPLVTFDDIVLREVDIRGGIFSPGIILCNSTNPCTNFVFDRVTGEDWSIFPYLKGVHCENTKGVALDSTLVPDCF